MPEGTTFLGALYILAITAVFVGLTTVLGLVARWLISKGKVSAMWAVFQRAFEVVQSIVAHIETDLRPTLAGVLADGKLTAEEKKLVKERALELAKKQLGESGLAQVQKYFGPAEVYLSGLIERAMGIQRAAGTLPPPAPATPRP